MVMKRVLWCLFPCVLILMVPAVAQSQTITYHVHAEPLAPWDSLTLLLPGPDVASTYTESAWNLKNAAPGFLLERFVWIRSAVTPVAGTIPANSIATFNVWMKKTTDYGTIYPYLKLSVYTWNDPLTGNNVTLCSVTGSTALTTTLTKYTLTCVIPSDIVVSSTRAFLVDVGNYVTVTPGHNVYVRIYYEGTLDGNYDSTVVVPQPLPPNITSLTPNTGPVGTTVTISGARFGATQGTSTVRFNGVTASPASWSNTSIQVPVPSGAATGLVVVTVNSRASNGVTFTVPPPSITTISPAGGGAGTYVTLTGTGFGATQVSSTLTFNGIAALPSSWSNTSILVPVPGNASTGPVVITVAAQASNGMTFTFSTVGSIAGVVRRASDNGPVSGVVVKALQSGTELASATSAADGSYSLPNLPVGIYDAAAYPTAYLAAVNTGTIVSANQTTTVNFSLAKPTISLLSPAAGPVGSTVTIKGFGFGSAQGASTLAFNGVAASPASWSDTSIATSVPVGAATGPVIVTVTGVASDSVTFSVGIGTVNGAVTQAGSGTPVVGALVELLQANVVKASTATTSGGTYSVSNLTPGAYDLRFSSTGLGTILSAGNTIAAGGSITVNAALPSPGTISGKVTKADGVTAIAGASVAILLGTTAAAAVTTDTSGNYAATLLSAATYAVQASASGYTTQMHTGVTVTTGNASTSDFSLAGQSIISYTYDSLGRLIGVADSLGGAATYTYDAAGNLILITNP